MGARPDGLAEVRVSLAHGCWFCPLPLLVSCKGSGASIVFLATVFLQYLPFLWRTMRSDPTYANERACGADLDNTDEVLAFAASGSVNS